MYVELRLDIPFEQLYHIVGALPFQEKNKLKELLLKETDSQYSKTLNETENFRKLLLNGPVMSKEQYENYKQLRKNFKQWSEKLYA